MFQKSDPPEAAPLLDPCLKGTQKFTQIDKNPKEGAIFQKSAPPEAAPLLTPCLKITSKVRKTSKIVKEVSSFKNLSL